MRRAMCVISVKNYPLILAHLLVLLDYGSNHLIYLDIYHEPQERRLWLDLRGRQRRKQSCPPQAGTADSWVHRGSEVVDWQQWGRSVESKTTGRNTAARTHCCTHTLRREETGVGDSGWTVDLRDPAASVLFYFYFFYLGSETKAEITSTQLIPFTFSF